jgi:hypothetical protein
MLLKHNLLLFYIFLKSKTKWGSGFGHFPLCIELYMSVYNVCLCMYVQTYMRMHVCNVFIKCMYVRTYVCSFFMTVCVVINVG